MIEYAVGDASAIYALFVANCMNFSETPYVCTNGVALQYNICIACDIFLCGFPLHYIADIVYSCMIESVLLHCTADESILLYFYLPD